MEGLEERMVLSYMAPVSYPTGTNTAGVAIGKFNGDATPDFAVANQAAAGSVSVFLGNVDGTYQPKVDYSAGAYSTDVKSADFNRDGFNDLAVVGTTGTVSVLLGNGDGTFAAATSNAVGFGSHSMNLGDFNGDGFTDIATMNSTTASVLLGNGDGTFQTHIDSTIPGNSTSTVTGDFNHDGFLDLATSNTASVGTVTVLRGRGDGSFDPASSYPAFSAPVYLGSGDFNHDGYDDFAVANSYAASSMSILINNGDGTYAPPKTYGIAQTGYEIEVEDFNGDGNDDFAVRGGSKLMVHLGRGNGTFYPSVTYAVPAGRFEMGGMGDLNGDGAVDFLYPSGSGVTAVLNAADDQRNLAGAVSFALTTPTSSTSGSALPMTIRAIDANGDTATGFLGTVFITSNDPASVSSIAYTFTAADAGVHTFTGSVRLVTEGAQSVTVSAPFMTDATATVTVTPRVSRFGFSAPTTSVAGDSFSVTVSALDALGNVATGYTSSVHFTSSDGQGILPSDYTFTSDDAGVHTFTVALRSAGTRYVGLTEVAGVAVGGSNVSVTPASASTLVLAGGNGAIGIAGSVTVVARDVYGNVDTNYSGTVHVTSSDSAAVLPPDTTLTAGVGSFSVTLMTVGVQTITAADVANPSLYGSVLSTATPPIARQFVVTGYPSTVAGVANNFTVTVRDSIGQIASGYTGTVYFSSSDVQAGLPSAYTFTAADGGVHTFSASLKTAGTQSLAVRDSTGLLYGTQMGIVVTPAAFGAYRLSVPNLPDSKGHILVTAGDVIALTVRATDVYGNTVSGYRGKVKFTCTDVQAGLPTDYSFQTTDNGAHTFNVALKTATPADVFSSFTVTDASNAANLATINYFEVVNAAAAKVVINTPTNATAGTAFSVKVTMVDAYGNKVKNYFGTVHFASTAASTGLPADYTFTVDDAGTHDFLVTLTTGVDQTFSVVDTGNSSLFASSLIKVKAAGTTTTGGGGGGGGTGGGSGGGGGGGGGGKKV